MKKGIDLKSVGGNRSQDGLRAAADPGMKRQVSSRNYTVPDLFSSPDGGRIYQGCMKARV